MEPQEVLALVLAGLGLLALKAFFDALNFAIPIWAVYLVIFTVALLALGGLLALLFKQSRAGESLSLGRLFLPFLELKHALRESFYFWLNWPAWVLLLLLGKLFEPWLFGMLKESGYGALAGAVPYAWLLSVLPFLLSVIVVGALLLFATVFVILFLRKESASGANICPKCGSLHSPADNYCGNCGAGLKRRG